MVTFTYKETERNLESRFRFWHVESLLNQAAELLDKCNAQLKDLNSLNTSITEQNILTETLETEIALEKDRLDFLERDLVLSNITSGFYNNNDQNFKDVRTSAQNLRNNAPTGIEHFRAEMVFNEALVTRNQRAFEKDINDKRNEYASSDKEFNTKYQQLREKMLSIRKAESASGGSLDFNGQAKLVFDLLDRNYSDARDRALVALDGIQKIYGFNINKKVGIEKIKPIDKKGIDEAVNDLAVWVNDTIEYLVAYQQLDQSFTRVISLFTQMTNDEWKLLNKAKDEHELFLRLPKDLFPNHDNIRLRGIGASLIGNVATIPWCINLRVPENGIYRREGKDIEIDQKLLPECILGRVENRATFKSTEMCGAISLMNASPLGNDQPNGLWKFTIIKPKKDSEAFLNVEDIILELSLVGQALPAKKPN